MAKSKKPVRHSGAFEQEFARFQENFAAVVKEQRLKAKLSRRELAKRAKLSVSTLIHIEQGQGNPMLNSMENLAIALRTRLSRLFELTQEREGR
jgi:transcriptional regulator with XRE-family HTH domain